MKSSHQKAGIIIVAVIGAVILAALTIFLIPTKKVQLMTVQAMPMDLTQAVTATGQVAGDENVDLAFDTAGTVASVNVSVGDTVQKGQVLGALSSDIMSANLESAQANVVAAQAQLATLQQGNRPEAVAVYQQKANDAGSSLGTALHDTYLKVLDAVQNKSDVLFDNPRSANPTVNTLTMNQLTKYTIDNERIAVGTKLAAWATIPVTDFSVKTQATASDTLNYTRNFLNDLSAIVQNLTVGNSAMTQAQITADGAAVTAAASEVNAALTEYINALSAYNEANNNLTLEAAGGTTQDIQAQTAKVTAAQAQADLIQSQINHTVIRAPFTGIVSAVNLKVGEVATPGNPAFSMITKGLKVEVQIPENNISKINASNTAQVTLDAYGASTTFPAVVSQIDPTETVVNGINSYKVTLEFTQDDTRIRSGMTANVSVITGYASQAIAVPTPAIITKGTQTFVLVQNAQGAFVQQQVQTGISGMNGYTAITSGLSQGDKVASFGTQTQ